MHIMNETTTGETQKRWDTARHILFEAGVSVRDLDATLTKLRNILSTERNLDIYEPITKDVQA